MARTNKDFEGKREQLIQLALSAFIEKGYENTKISDLQKILGLTKGGMYHYFTSKEEILDAVIEYGLAQGVDELCERMKEIPLEKKLLFFFFNAAKNEVTQNLYKYSKSDGSSIVNYRLRDKNIEAMIPIMKDIICEYNDSGFYHSDYPEEMSEFCAVLAKAVTEDGILPKTDLAGKKRRTDALLDLWNKCMCPPLDHLEEIRNNLYEIIEKR